MRALTSDTSAAFDLTWVQDRGINAAMLAPFDEHRAAGRTIRQHTF